MSEMLTLAVLIISLVALTIVLRLDANQRHEYEFFVAEYKSKFGMEIGLLQTLYCYNAALGGISPKWHWIEPVVSSSVGADYFKNERVK
jgi:hypothetical protein